MLSPKELTLRNLFVCHAIIHSSQAKFRKNQIGLEEAGKGTLHLSLKPAMDLFQASSSSAVQASHLLRWRAERSWIWRRLVNHLSPKQAGHLLFSLLQHVERNSAVLWVLCCFHSFCCWALLLQQVENELIKRSLILFSSALGCFHCSSTIHTVSKESCVVAW